MPFDGTNYERDPILRVIDQVDALICDEEHWWQVFRSVRFVDGKVGSHCPVTAIQACGCSIFADAPEINYIQRALQDITGEEQSSIPTYNNAPERKFSEIKALIENARQLRVADIVEKVAA